MLIACFVLTGASLQTGVYHSVVFDYIFLQLRIAVKDCKIKGTSPAELRLAPEQMLYNNLLFIFTEVLKQRVLNIKSSHTLYSVLYT